MAQMNWIKTSDKLPDADDIYLVVVDYKLMNGKTNRVVTTCGFSHNLHLLDYYFDSRPGWYDQSFDPDDGFSYYEIEDDVVYWMPFPKAPKS